jgi:uncharacterized caspase-like protein
VKGADVGFFYYSGHGFQTNHVDQQHPVNHIVPVDFDIGDADPVGATLALDVVVETLKNEARVGLIFMDACRNDPQLTAAAQRVAAGSKSVTISRGFSPVNAISGRPYAPQSGKAKRPTGLLIAYATDPGNVALEGDKGLLSPFTTALVAHMRTPGLSVAEMMGRVSAEVSLETQGRQTPWSVASLTAGLYQFLPSETARGGAANREDAPRRASASSRSRGAISERRSNGARRASLPPNLGAGIGAGM